MKKRVLLTIFSMMFLIGTVALGLEATLHEYVSANLLLKGEALDSDDDIFWDEAFFTIQKEYFTFEL